MQTRALRTLVTISKVGAFATAADMLKMTQSAVSMQMKSLESELGFPLFDRNFRPPSLTPIGRQVADYAVNLLKAEERIIDLSHGKDELTGQFRIGFVATAGVRLLPSFLRKAAESAPHAKFEVEIDVSTNLENTVLSGLMDAAVITASKSPNPALCFTTLREENFVFARPLSKHETVGELNNAELPFLQFTPDIGIGRLVAEHMVKHENIEGHNVLILNSVEAIMECVNQGIGYTLLPEPDVRHYANDKLVEIKQPDEKLTRQLVLITQPDGPIDRRIDAIIELFS